jgi:hypothetical protein
MLSPVGELRPPRFQHRLTAVSAETPELLKDEALDADVLVFSKSFLASNEALAERARSKGLRVVFDVCDDHYGHPQHGAHFRRMSALAHQVTCNTAGMAEAARPYCAADPIVIPDPYEGPKGAARFEPGERLRLLWFGHPSNLDSLGAAMDDLIAYAADQPLEITVLTQFTPDIEKGCDDLSERSGNRLSISAKPWSLPGQWRELAACDAVIIPSRMAAQWAPTTPRLSDGCRRLFAERSRLPGQISAAQAYIQQTFAPTAAAAQWARVLETQFAERAAVR